MAESQIQDGLDGKKNPFLDLDQEDEMMAMYIWIDGTGKQLRSKTRTLPYKENPTPDDIPVWDTDGRKTDVTMEDDDGQFSDIFLKPVAIFKDPFRRGNNLLVLCETYALNEKNPNRLDIPHKTNTRASCAANMIACADEKPWFGIEQEYTMFDYTGKHPYGWPKNGYPGPQGPYYCGAGADKVKGRKIVEGHYRACMYAGVKIAGSNAEVMPSQWEYQVGPCEGIEMGDHLWVSRWILCRIAEEFNVVISFDPKPITGDWNGAGCHTNISTEAMRQDGGYDKIVEAIKAMEDKAMEHIAEYDPHGGDDNKRRLTGQHETASWEKFSWGVAHRGASIRIPRQVHTDQKGYFEDRRPSSNADPYSVTNRIVRTICLGE